MTAYTEEQIASIEQRILKWQGYRTVQDELGFWSLLKPDGTLVAHRFVTLTDYDEDYNVKGNTVGLIVNSNIGENELWGELAPHPWTDLNAAVEALRFATSEGGFSLEIQSEPGHDFTVRFYIVEGPDLHGESDEPEYEGYEAEHPELAPAICLALIQYLDEQQHQTT